MKKVFLVLAFMLLLASRANAACTGSGAVWSCPAGASASDVQIAINAASVEAVITFASGSYSWVSPAPQFTKVVTLVCASVGTCTVTVNGTAFNPACKAGWGTGTPSPWIVACS